MSQNKKQNCIIDARVSTDKQLLGHGLENQEEVCRSFAIRNNWHIVKVFKKSFSGRSEERTDFEEILKFIKQSLARGIKIDFYVVKSIDRLTRNGHLTYSKMKARIQALGTSLIDTDQIIQNRRNTLEHLDLSYSWSIYEPSETNELLEAKKGKDNVRDLLTKMIGTEVSMTRQGFSVRAPNDGYLNVKEIIDGMVQNVLTQDINRAHFFKEIFKLRATNHYSDQDIVQKINAMGYRSKPHKIWKGSKSEKRVIGFSTPKKLTVKHLQSIIQRTMYAGIKMEKWNVEPVRAVFLENQYPIVSIREFNKANRGKVYIKENSDKSIEVLTNYSERAIAKRLKYHHDYKYDKLITCSVCSKPFKNSGKGNKGKLGKYYKAYHCDRSSECKKNCGRIPKKEFEEKVDYLLENLKFNNDFFQKLQEKLLKKYREREKDILDKSVVIGKNVSELKEKQSKILATIDKLSSSIIISQKEKEYEDIEKEITEATNLRDQTEIKERDIKTFVRYAKNLMEHPIKILGNNKYPYQQKAFFKLIFKEVPTYKEIINGTPKLSLVFRLSEDFKVDESALVTLRGIEPRFTP